MFKNRLKSRILPDPPFSIYELGRVLPKLICRMNELWHKKAEKMAWKFDYLKLCKSKIFCVTFKHIVLGNFFDQTQASFQRFVWLTPWSSCHHSKDSHMSSCRFFSDTFISHDSSGNNKFTMSCEQEEIDKLECLISC